MTKALTDRPPTPHPADMQLGQRSRAARSSTCCQLRLGLLGVVPVRYGDGWMQRMREAAGEAMASGREARVTFG